MYNLSVSLLKRSVRGNRSGASDTIDRTLRPSTGLLAGHVLAGRCGHLEGPTARGRRVPLTEPVHRAGKHTCMQLPREALSACMHQQWLHLVSTCIYACSLNAAPQQRAVVLVSSSVTTGIASDRADMTVIIGRL